jgi:hypothetical protein
MSKGEKSAIAPWGKKLQTVSGYIEQHSAKKTGCDLAKIKIFYVAEIQRT